MKACSDFNREFDLRSLVERDTAIRQRGRWFSGPCPFCGGEDRFNLKQGENGWVWFCRGCGEGKYHTAVDYLMRRENKGVSEVLRMMEGGGKAVGTGARHQEGGALHLGRQAGLVDWEVWNEQANRFIDECMHELWFGEERGRKYLAEERGLGGEVLMANFTGYQRKERFVDAKRWGFSGRNKIWLPAGIVFPCLDGNMRVAGIKIRQLEGKPKYVKVAGSKSGVFGFRNLRGADIIGISEGEIDCLTLEQEAGDLLGACTLGSAADHFRNLDFARWGVPFILAEAILLFFDNDEAGKRGAKRMRVNRKVMGAGIMAGFKDLNEMLVRGEDVGGWVYRKMVEVVLKA
jgi:DNA primase